MIRSTEGFSFASALDLNLGYYHIKLDDDAMLRMKGYVDNLLILKTTNSSFKDHLLKFEIILARLSTDDMRVNTYKFKFCVEQKEYLRYWITRQGIQPIRNKVEAIINIKALKTR
jgi:uncharacterized protein with von Willebrand factor type A (vWA) domain